MTEGQGQHGTGRGQADPLQLAFPEHSLNDPRLSTGSKLALKSKNQAFTFGSPASASDKPLPVETASASAFSLRGQHRESGGTLPRGLQSHPDARMSLPCPQ